MNFINNDPDHIEVLESKLTSSISPSNTEVYSFKGKLREFIVSRYSIKMIASYLGEGLQWVAIIS